MSSTNKRRNRWGLLRWFAMGLGLLVVLLACGITLLHWLLSRPKVNTTTPDAEEIALCREMLLLHPEIEIELLGYFRLESLDISHGFKFIAKTDDPTELLDEKHKERITFRENFDGGFIDRPKRASWWNRPKEGVFGGHFLDASDGFIWHASMCYLPNDDGTLTVWAYAESGANYSEENLVSSERLEFSGHYYQFVTDKEWLSWDEALARCEAMGGYLVVINDQEENDFLGHLLGVGRLPAFLGGHAKENSNEWEWVDGSPMSYQNWIEGQPVSARDAKNYLRAQPLVWPGWCAFPGHALGFVCEWDSEPTKE